ncbi:hypothetical protein EOE18_13675 [Novosphingobium umbonatum]|uniref:Uncharacterized protein n=1 Tax=Novosphingobium umbonatum TaxID=1908524 RepID=A0A3S2Y5E3_9SPHN|nr:hypothetical protein [Novosphingobium umbonatum]RVU03904.1 hypothetical protein EOE18_13675 [Novosphingobium umbonatum]
MSRDLFSTTARTGTRPAAPNWKPEGCADCGTLHPSHSLTGPRGPWRCQDCHREAAAKKKAA